MKLEREVNPQVFKEMLHTSLGENIFKQIFNDGEKFKRVHVFLRPAGKEKGIGFDHCYITTHDPNAFPSRNGYRIRIDILNKPNEVSIRKKYDDYHQGITFDRVPVKDKNGERIDSDFLQVSEEFCKYLEGLWVTPSVL